MTTNKPIWQREVAIVKYALEEDATDRWLAFEKKIDFKLVAQFSQDRGG